jgi:hypothetical protein
MAPISHTKVVTAWLPIRSTIFDDDVHSEAAGSCIQSFLIALPEVLPILAPEVSAISISDEPPEKGVMDSLSRNSSVIASPLFDFYGIIATVSFVDTRNNPEQGSDMSYLDAIAAYYLEKALSLALQLSELAYPGTIFTSEGLVTDGNMALMEIEKKYSLSCCHPRELAQNDWPEIKFIDLTLVAVWAKSIGFSESSFATTRVQRTLAAFTHVLGLGWRHDGEILFRSMQGLESFYCDGIGDLRRQLSHKSQIWLGANPEKLNIVGHLYDLRSKFIHGAAKMQYWHDVSDPWEEDNKTMEHFSGGVELAIRILLSTLQRCILESVKDVNWNYVCQTEPSSSAGSPSSVGTKYPH